MSASGPFGSLPPDVPGAPPGPASRALADRLRAVESRDVTYLADDWPVFWEEAAGANVRDADGNVYVDLSAGFGVALIGHRHPAVVAAVTEQAGRLVHGMGDVHPPAVKVRLLERLCALAPWADARATLAPTGTEAVEIALKTAYLATGRPGVIAFEGAYHGLTLGSLATTARGHFREPFAGRLYGGVAFAPFAMASGDPGEVERALARVQELLANGAPNGDPIGAVIVEPVQGRAGARVPAPGFLAEVAKLAREAGAIVVADEVLTGLGRCGVILASERVGLVADLVCVGKALGGGLPLSACLGRREVMDAWPPSRGEAVHTSTFLGHPLACAAALASLDVLEGEGVPGRAEALGTGLAATLAARLRDVSGVGEVRGLGLLLGIELVGSGGVTPAAGAAARVAGAALAGGVIVLPAGDAGNVVEVTPPVVLTDEQAERAVEVLVHAIEEAS